MLSILKEKLISLSRKEKYLSTFLNIYINAFFILLLLSLFIRAIIPIAFVMIFIGACPITLIDDILNCINTLDIETIRKNKLRYIILSDASIIGSHIMLFILFLMLCIISIFVELNLILSLIIVIISFFISFKVTMMISNYFEKKLID